MTTPKELRHIVTLQFKEGTSETELAEIVRRFGGLQNEVPGVKGFEWGLNNSNEGLSESLTHCFQLTFASEADRDAYLPHPKHTAFADWVGAWVQRVVVVDYWAHIA